MRNIDSLRGDAPSQAKSETVDNWKGTCLLLRAQNPNHFQLWEQKYGLPVRRTNDRQIIYAVTAETVDAWANSRRSLLKRKKPHAGGPAALSEVPDHVVGREEQKRAMIERFAFARASQTQFIFVLGDEGVGKTTLVDSFVTDLSSSSHPFYYLHGRCSPGLANSAALFSLMALEVLIEPTLTDFCTLAELLRTSASTWWAELTLQGRGPSYDALVGTRLLIELKAFLHALTNIKPLVLFIDDLQWCDESTLALLAHIGLECPSLRLLVIGAFRSNEVSPDGFLLQRKRDLQARSESWTSRYPH